MDKQTSSVPVFDGLRLAVQFRANRDELGALALLSGIAKTTLQRFADTGEISERDRRTLEVYQ